MRCFARGEERLRIGASRLCAFERCGLGGYDVGAGNVALAGVVEDIAAIGTELKDADFAGAKAIYMNGQGLTDPTLQKFAKGETGTYTSGAEATG